MNFKKHLNLINLYLPIAIILLILSTLFNKGSFFQIQIILTATFLYFSLSLMHHYLDKSLTRQALVEYILMVSLILVIFGSNMK